MRTRHQDDLLELVERIVADTETAGEKTVTLRIGIVRALLQLAKRAPMPQGRPPVKGRDRVQESVALHTGRSFKRQFIAEGMKKEAAHEKAAEEVAAKLPTRNLAVSTVKRRME